MTEDYEGSPGTGSNTATWQVSNLSSGIYDVEVNWTAYTNRATNVPYSVYDGSTLLGPVLVNQQIAPFGGVVDQGIQFQSLGQFTITSGTLKVVVTDNANAYVIADGMIAEAASTPVVVDDSQYGFATTGSGWHNLTGVGYNNELDYAAAGTGANTATWTLSGLASRS